MTPAPEQVATELVQQCRHVRCYQCGINLGGIDRGCCHRGESACRKCIVTFLRAHGDAVMREAAAIAEEGMRSDK